MSWWFEVPPRERPRGPAGWCPHPADEALVASLAAGDTHAFTALVARYRRRVYGICLHYFRNPADAEDAAQDAFFTLYRRAATFRGDAAFSTWMYRVTTNACNDLARHRARRPQAGPTTVEDLAGEPTDDDPLATRELSMELNAALRMLDADSRAAIVLHDVQGLPYFEIAERLGLPIGTVKSRIHRSHARLAAALDHLRQHPGGPAEPATLATPPTDRHD